MTSLSVSSKDHGCSSRKSPYNQLTKLNEWMGTTPAAAWSFGLSKKNVNGNVRMNEWSVKIIKCVHFRKPARDWDVLCCISESPIILLVKLRVKHAQKSQKRVALHLCLSTPPQVSSVYVDLKYASLKMSKHFIILTQFAFISSFHHSCHSHCP